MAWIYTRRGLISVVLKEDVAIEHRGWHVKSRVARPLEWLAEHFENLKVLESYTGSDYGFRIIIKTRRNLDRIIKVIVDDITYTALASAAEPDAYPGNALFDTYIANFDTYITNLTPEPERSAWS
jgi:hypothetical protein